ncbi:MAG: PAS domain S-box protein [Myxococcales bacterium FL481]|nr:MAG: PAS domain S-box protein [Myxococcales bacterium FL481]
MAVRVAVHMEVKRTRSIDVRLRSVRASFGRSARTDAYAEIVDGLPIAAAVLDSYGILITANQVFAELLQIDRRALQGEPLLSWIRRASEREAFGREFMALRNRKPGHGFVREIGLMAALGPDARCTMRTSKLPSGYILLTCEQVESGDPETEFGRSVSRALDALDQGVLVVDGEGRIMSANPGARNLLGDGLVGRGFLEFVSPSAVEDLARALRLARAGSWQGAVDMLRLDGEPVSVELSLAAGSGEGAPAVCLIHDVRARRRRQFDERLIRHIDRSLISSSDPREAVTEACSALIVGLSAVRGVLLVQLSGGWERWEVRPDDAPGFVALPDGLDPPPQWSQVDVQTVEYATPELDALCGALAAHEMAARVTLRAPGGVAGHLVMIFDRRRPWGDHELGLLKQVGGQLALGLANGLLMLETRMLAAYQSRVLDQTTVLLNSVDAEGRVVTWNRASEQLLGVGSSAAKGLIFGVEISSAQDPHQWREFWDELLREGVIAGELAVQHADGSEIPLHLEGRLLREGREVTGAVLVGLDLRPRRALQGQILRTQKLAAVGLMAAGIAHEINNPLSGVVGYSKLLLEQPHLDNEIRRKVERIADSGERCRKIVEGVLLFSRQQGGVRQRVDLRDIVDRVVGIGEYQWRVQNVRILREVNESAEVMADADQMEQVLLNLLSNAVDAMPHGGRVHIALARREAGGAVLTVQDEGPGIPEEIQSRIFDPFFSTKDIGKGTGLGLAISYGIVRDHGGDIFLQHTARGEGATFRVVLPADGKPVTPAAPPRDSLNPGKATRS